MNQVGIYGLYCVVNRKWYIGQSAKLTKRRQNHISKLRKGIHYNQHLQRAFRKHGEWWFEFQILEICPMEQLDVREKFWIDHHRSCLCGFNVQGGGQLNRILSSATRRKMSRAHKGKRFTQEHRDRIGIALRAAWRFRYVRPLSESHCRAISRAKRKRDRLRLQSSK